jgi:DNA-binding NarL/FixJ family response regulator
MSSQQTTDRGLRILLGDDHVLMLGGIRSLLEPQFQVSGSATDGRQLVDEALRLQPDLVVLDVSMPRLNGFEAAAQIKVALPQTRLIFLSMHSNPMYLRKAQETGADAYVLKTGMANELLEAIRLVAYEGKRYVSPGFHKEVTAQFLNPSLATTREEEGLTARQREILQLVAEGRLNKEIAHELGISIKTVDFHKSRLMAKLGAHSTGDLVRIAVEQGFIPASTPRNGGKSEVPV